MNTLTVAAMPVSVQMTEIWMIGSFLEAMQWQAVIVIPSGQIGSKTNLEIV